MWSRCGGWYLLFANGDLLDHERYVWPSRHIKIIDVIDFRLPSEVKSLVPVYRRKHLRCMWRLSENSIIWTQKILAQKLEILLEIGKSQSLARKGLIINKIQQNNNDDNKSKKKKTNCFKNRTYPDHLPLSYVRISVYSKYFILTLGRTNILEKLFQCRVPRNAEI